jgi:hypothetical protein
VAPVPAVGRRALVLGLVVLGFAVACGQDGGRRSSAAWWPRGAGARSPVPGCSSVGGCSACWRLLDVDLGGPACVTGGPA